MDPALRVVKLIRIAMLASVVLYVFIAEMAAPKSAAPPNLMIFYVLTFMAIVSVILITGLRRFWIIPATTAASVATSGYGDQPLAHRLHPRIRLF